ncbi:acyltransferase [Bacteroidia bacterium]|nr:acyltransferase [Bacteroidia bacterium]
MKKDWKYEHIRPFYDEEVNAAMKRIADNNLFDVIMPHLFPDKEIEDVRTFVRNIDNIQAFQNKITTVFCEKVIEKTISKFTYSGLENINKNTNYLFISNHRDIVLDAMFFNYVLNENGHNPSEITFGSNLMMSPFIIDFGKANRMFKVDRPNECNGIKDFYEKSMLLSQYIYDCINTYGESIWIAQRNGRTKNGIDKTDPGIIKMFYMCTNEMHNKDNQPLCNVNILTNLHIVPVTISYQYEPCDIQKVLELYYTQKNGFYKKAADEDLNSIITGIKQFKGSVHLHIGQQLQRTEIELFSHLPHNKFNIEIAKLIDTKINTNYKHFDTESAIINEKHEELLQSNVEDKDLLLQIFDNIYKL